MLGLKLRYRGKTPLDSIKLNHRLFGTIHKRKSNCVSYTPGLLHNKKYTKLYNGCYFIPQFPDKTLPEINLENLKKEIEEKISVFCLDLDIENFELKEDEFFAKYIFKNGYEYWRDYANDSGRIFKCNPKYRLQ